MRFFYTCCKLKADGAFFAKLDSLNSDLSVMKNKKEG
jgi:hypothetical protein